MTRSDGVMVQRGLIDGGVAVAESKLELLESCARRPHRWKSGELRRREIEAFTPQAALPPLGVDLGLRNVKPWLASILLTAR